MQLASFGCFAAPNTSTDSLQHDIAHDPSPEMAGENLHGLEKLQNKNKIELAQLDASADAQADKTGWLWIDGQPKENYTLQLFATKNLPRTNKFIKEYALTGQVKVIDAIVKGSTYYKVILGSFKTWNDAAVEIGALAQALRDQRPWVRKFSSLYPEMPKGATDLMQTARRNEKILNEKEIANEPEQVQPVALGEQKQETVVGEVISARTHKTQPETAIASLSDEFDKDAQQTRQKAMKQPVNTTQNDIKPDEVFTAYTLKQVNSNALDAQLKEQLVSGLVAIREKKHRQAFESLLPLAQAALPEAQYRVAQLFSLGQGVGKDDTSAFNFMKQAAEQGHPYAQQSLANYYLSGMGVVVSTSLANYWQQTSLDNIKKLENQQTDLLN